MVGYKSYKPSYLKSISAHLKARLGKGVGLKHPIRTTFKVKAYLTKQAAFGQRAYPYSKLRKYATHLKTTKHRR